MSHYTKKKKKQALKLIVFCLFLQSEISLKKRKIFELQVRLFTWNDVILLLCLAFFPSSQLPHFVEPRLLRRHLSERNVLQTIENFVTPAALLSNTFDRASSMPNCEHAGLQCDSSDRMRLA